MSNEKFKLAKIVLTSKDNKKVIELSIEDAKDLYEQLKGLFEREKEIQFVPSQPIIIEKDHWPYPWQPYQPIWYDITKDKKGSLQYPQIMCSTKSGNMNINYCGE
jgi:hypothetical protein